MAWLSPYTASPHLIKELSMLDNLFAQLSLFSAPLHSDPRCNNMTVTLFDIGARFSRIESTDGVVAVVVDVGQVLPQQNEYLHLLETNFDFSRTNVAALKKTGGAWQCNGIKSLDTIRLEFPSGHRVDSRQLNRILRFFNWAGIEKAEMIFSDNPFTGIVIAPELNGNGAGILNIFGIIAPIIDDDRDDEWIYTPLDEMPISA